MSDQLKGTNPVRSYADLALQLRVTEARLDDASDALAAARPFVAEGHRLGLRMEARRALDHIDAVLARTPPRSCAFLYAEEGTTAVADTATLRRETPQPLRSRFEMMQSAIFRWVERTFGNGSIRIGERVARFFEEAAELAQAEMMSAEMAHRIVAHVYSKPPGEPLQEIGGVGVTLLAYCEAREVSAEQATLAEFERCVRMPAHHFRQRHNRKADAGIASYAEVEAH